uniref:Uncharacterized protein n=1 Tax=Sphaerodactylus townsendi TaxID=933632 RepID=A0ACB8ENA8_9SAUR
MLLRHRKTCPYYEELDMLLGTNATIRPTGIVRSHHFHMSMDTAERPSPLQMIMEEDIREDSQLSGMSGNSATLYSDDDEGGEGSTQQGASSLQAIINNAYAMLHLALATRKEFWTPRIVCKPDVPKGYVRLLPFSLTAGSHGCSTQLVQSPERGALLKKRSLRRVVELSKIGERMLDTTKGILDTAQSEINILNRHMSTIATAVLGTTAAIESLVQIFHQKTTMTGQMSTSSSVACSDRESGGVGGGIPLRRLRELLAKKKARQPHRGNRRGAEKRTKKPTKVLDP